MSESTVVFEVFRPGDTLPNGQTAPKGWCYLETCQTCEELHSGTCDNVRKPCPIKKERCGKADRELNRRRAVAWGEANWGRFMWMP